MFRPLQPAAAVLAVSLAAAASAQPVLFDSTGGTDGYLTSAHPYHQAGGGADFTRDLVAKRFTLDTPAVLHAVEIPLYAPAGATDAGVRVEIWADGPDGRTPAAPGLPALAASADVPLASLGEGFAAFGFAPLHLEAGLGYWVVLTVTSGSSADTVRWGLTPAPSAADTPFAFSASGGFAFADTSSPAIGNPALRVLGTPVPSPGAAGLLVAAAIAAAPRRR